MVLNSLLQNMAPLNQSIIEIPDKHENYGVEMIVSLHLIIKFNLV